MSDFSNPEEIKRWWVAKSSSVDSIWPVVFFLEPIVQIPNRFYVLESKHTIPTSIHGVIVDSAAIPDNSKYNGIISFSASVDIGTTGIIPDTICSLLQTKSNRFIIVDQWSNLDEPYVVSVSPQEYFEKQLPRDEKIEKRILEAKRFCSLPYNLVGAIERWHKRYCIKEKHSEELLAYKFLWRKLAFATKDDYWINTHTYVCPCQESKYPNSPSTLFD